MSYAVCIIQALQDTGEWLHVIVCIRYNRTKKTIFGREGIAACAGSKFPVNMLHFTQFESLYLCIRTTTMLSMQKTVVYSPDLGESIRPEGSISQLLHHVLQGQAASGRPLGIQRAGRAFLEHFVNVRVREANCAGVQCLNARSTIVISRRGGCRSTMTGKRRKAIGALAFATPGKGEHNMAAGDQPTMLACSRSLASLPVSFIRRKT